MRQALTDDEVTQKYELRVFFKRNDQQKIDN